MAFILSDRVKETSISSGYGSVVLNGAFGGFQSFAAGIGNNNSTYYGIENEQQWEVGIGTYSASSNSISRDTVLASSNGNNKINLNGVSIVFCTYAAGRSVYYNDQDFLDLKGHAGLLLAKASLVPTGTLLHDVRVSGQAIFQPESDAKTSLVFIRSGSGNFFHAYVNDGTYRTLALYTDGQANPTWRLGLKNNPNSSYDAPAYAYIYGKDGTFGLAPNSTNKLELTNTAGLSYVHNNTEVLRMTATTGVYLNSLASTFPALSLNGGPSMTANIQEWKTYGGIILSAVDSQGRFAINKTSATYQLDVAGTGRFNTIAFADGTFQSTAIFNQTYLNLVGLSGISVSGSPILTSGTITAFLSDTAVNSGTYGDATNIASFTVDRKGRLIAASSVPISYASPVHTHTSSQITDFNTAVSGLLSPYALLNSGNFANLFVNTIPVSVSGHTHVAANITDFNTAVNSASPVRNIIGSGFIIVSSGTGGIFAVSSSGLQPSGNYSLVGHTHTASDITNFNTAVSGLVSGIYQPLLSNPTTGIGTSGYLTRWTGANTVGTGVVYDNGTNVGIGTASPSQKLHVNGDIRLDQNIFTTQSNAQFLTTAGFALPIKVGSLTISSTYGGVDAPLSGLYVQGNAGIGAISPAAKLHIRSSTGDVSEAGGVIIEGTGAGARTWQLTPTTADTLLLAIPGLRVAAFNPSGKFFAGGLSGTSGGGARFTASTSGVTVGQNYTTAIPTPEGAIIEGSVGIGTASPSQKLDVRGNAYVSGLLNITSGNFGDAITFHNGYKIRTFAGGGLEILSAPYTRIGNTGGTQVANFTAGTNVGAGLNITPIASQTGLVITGAAAQSADLQQWQNSAGTALVRVDAAGSISGVASGVFMQRLGVGTSSPSATLDVLDTVLASGGSNAGSAVNIAQTWNTSGVPTSILLNVTDVSSNTSSSLMSLRVGGANRFNVDKNGIVIASSTIVAAGNLQSGASIYTQNTLGQIGWQPGGNWDLVLIRDAANILAQRNAANAQTLRVYNTFTDVSNYERAKIAWESNILRIGTEQLGTGSARALELQTSGVTRAILSESTAQFTLQNNGGGAVFTMRDTSGANKFANLGLSGPGTRCEFGMGAGLTVGFGFINQGGWTPMTITNGTNRDDNEIRIGTNGAGFTGLPCSIILGNTFSPTFGGGAYVWNLINPTVNQTGGASGITRGIYIIPTLTSAADYRSIESTNGSVVLTDTYSAGSGSLAGSLLNLNQTWNTSGTPTAIRLNVTDTASNANSILMDLQVSGSSRFKVEKSGSAVVTTNLYVFGTGDADTNRTGLSHQFSGTKLGFLVNGLFRATASSVGIVVRNDGGYGFSPDGNASNTPDTLLNRDAAGALAQRNGFNAQVFRVYNTFTDSGNYERAKIAWESNVLRIGTENAGTGSARALEIQTNGSTQLTIAANGITTFTNGLFFGSAANSANNASANGTGNETVFATSQNYAPVSGSRTIFASTNSFQPTSGVATYTGVGISPTINQTGGANGITRGVYVNPTLTAAADWRSIETTNSSGWAIFAQGTAPSYFNGNVGIGTNSPTARLHVQNSLSTATGVIVRGAAAQSADLQQWQNSAGTILARVDAAGSISGVGSGIFMQRLGVGTSSPSSALDTRSSGIAGLIVQTSNNQNIFQYLKGDGTNILRGTWDGSNFHHYMNGNIYYNLNNFGYTFDGNSLNGSFINVNNNAYIALNSATTTAPGNANIWAGPNLYATSGQLTSISPFAFSTWAWNGTDGFSITSRGYLKQTQQSATTGDARLSIARGTDNAELFTVNYSGGNIGIGTISPTQKLDVRGSAFISGALYDSKNSIGTSGQVLVSTPNGIQWQNVSVSGGGGVSSGVAGTGLANYTARWLNASSLTTGILYDNGTNVGIGTASPTSMLSVGASNNFTVDSAGNVNLVSPASLQVNRANDIVGNPAINLSNQFGLQLTGTSGDFQINRRFGGVWSNAITVTNSGGRVGIGTVNPSQALDVNGNAYFNGSVLVGGYACYGARFGTYLWAAADTTIQTDTGYSTLFNVGATEIARITSNGLGIRTSSPSTTLDVRGTGYFSESIRTSGTVVFASGNTGNVGVMQWNNGEGTVSLGLKGGNVTLDIGQENVALCYNGTASTIAKGKAVYIVGAQGQRPSITLADNQFDATSSKTFGIVAENIASGAEGLVTTFGVATNIDTSAFLEGSGLWLGSSGNLTMTVPTQPLHSVFVGYALRQGVANGRIFVNPQNGYELQELHNVLIQNLASGDLLQYDVSVDLWKNRSLAQAKIASIDDSIINALIFG